MRLRETTPDDADLLVHLARRFNRGPESDSVRGWLDPEWDAGVVAETADGRPLGAAWWRAYRGDLKPSPLDRGVREVYVSVERGSEAMGAGPRLLRALIEKARADAGISSLRGRPVVDRDGRPLRKVARALTREGFEPGRSRGTNYRYLDVTRA